MVDTKKVSQICATPRVSHETYIPSGARTYFPFVLNTREMTWLGRYQAYWRFWQSVLVALVGRRPTVLREAYWNSMTDEQLAAFLSVNGLGKEHPSRQFVSSLIRQEESVLDVGCGTGVNYETLEIAGKAAGYVGVDSSPNAIRVARQMHPGRDFRVGSAVNPTAALGEQRFDVVLVRHVLEHLPDFEMAMGQAIAISKRIAIFVFYLPPRTLPLRVRVVSPQIDMPFYVNIYSRDAINRYLRELTLHYQWFDYVGLSQCKWLMGESNSILLVSHDPL